MTPVIFRTWKKQPKTVIALFPTIPASSTTIQSYEHIGQHGGADYQCVVAQTKLSGPDEYAELLQELKRIGYDDLKTYMRITPSIMADKLTERKHHVLDRTRTNQPTIQAGHHGIHCI